MSEAIDACLLAAARGGQLSQDALRQYQAELDEITRDAIEGEGLNFQEARTRAAERLQKQIERRLRRRKRMNVKQALRQDAITKRAANVAVGQREAAMLSVLSFDPRFRFVGENVEARARHLAASAFAEATDFLDKFRSRHAGLTRSEAGMTDVVRALFGEATSNEAKGLAAGILKANNSLVGRFNLAGGDIVRRKDWGWVQRHDATKIKAVAKADWIAFVGERLDPARMLNADGEAMTARQLARALDATYDKITTGDLDALAGIFDETYTSPVNARVAARELVFRDSRAWMEYQRAFGDDDMFGAITGHLERLARDTAVMEILGPYPKAQLENMKRIVAADRKAADVGKTDFRFLEQVFDEVTGEANTPHRERWARVMQGNRNLVTGARLGGAVFASIGDAGTALANARLNGVPTARLVNRWARLLNPADDADRKLAARAGFVAETWIGRSVAAQRFMNEVTGPGWTNAVTDTALRLSGLNAWTDSGKAAYGLELVGHMTDQAAKPFAEVEPALRGMLDRHGVTAAEWDLYRSTAIWRDDATGAELIRPEDVWLESFDMTGLPVGEKDARRALADKLGEMIQAELTFAIIQPTARTRAAVGQAGRPGTFFGELARTAALFKSFPVTFAYMTFSRARMLTGWRSRAEYLGAIAVGMTMAGALAEQASSVFRGKDPLAMDTPAFWGSAFARGGALGPLGDFFFAGLDGVNRHGNGILASLAGPILGSQLKDGTQLVLGNLRELVLEGEASNPGGDLVRFARGLLPGQSLWYARAAVERVIFDQVEELIDGPQARERFRRVESAARRDFEQNYWWQPGSPAATRLPALGNR